MCANIFSILMTILWSSVLIAIFSLLRTRTGLLHICSISTVILLYLFCALCYDDKPGAKRVGMWKQCHSAERQRNGSGTESGYYCKEVPSK